ncbi:LLM class flavin-dependent oxidoreductase [Streptomyces sp. NPDC002688]|uniref:LLM class flavin-dependent oxidoreductase n=1 Tax=Streptomyces sp. NPDC002688 TaxID=3154423 RepID=UPI003326ABCA
MPDRRAGVPLSVLDIAPVVRGSTAAQALRDTLDLARHAERLGYLRHWFSEHHSTLSLAASAPALLVAEAAGATGTLRVGAGGVLLAHQSPLTVAEQFCTLAAFHPDRVDLGVSPALGTMNPDVQIALRGEPGPFAADAFAGRTEELLRLLDPADTGGAVTVTPRPDSRPPVWLVGRDETDGALAGRLGLPFVFGYHFSPHAVDGALKAYRNAFRPSARWPEPYVVLDVMVLLAESEERARYLAGPLEVAALQMSEGRLGPYLRPEAVATAGYTEQQRAHVRAQFESQVVGDPAAARRTLTALLERTGADELMAITIVTDHSARLRSYELLAEVAADLRTR